MIYLGENVDNISRENHIKSVRTVHQCKVQAKTNQLFSCVQISAKFWYALRDEFFRYSLEHLKHYNMSV